MKIVSVAITTLILVAVLGTMIFGLLVYPIWAMIHCVTSETRSKKSKIIWLIVMIATWLTGAILYGLCASKRKLFQWISAILLVGTLSFITLFGAGMNYSTRLMNTELTDMLSKIDTLDTNELTPEEILKVKNSLLVVKQELNAGLLELEKKRKAISLIELARLIEKDSLISAKEYKDWMDKYLSRALLDTDALDRYIRSLKTQ